MREITVSAIQFDIKLNDLKHNVEKAFGMMERAANQGSNLIVLPEMWPIGFDYEDIQKLPPSYIDDILGLLADLAKKYKLYVVAGTMAETAEGKFYNTSFLVNPAGRPVGKYRKTHLFKEIGEQDFFAPGNDAFCIETEIGKIGIAICYDIRFPELFRQMALSGAEIICVPSQFPHPRLEHWQTLLRARAIENQLFVVGSNRVGRMGNTEYFGHSMIIGPYGEIIAEADEDEEILTETIDIDKMYEVRKVLPSFSERRPDVYPNIISEGEKSLPYAAPSFRTQETKSGPFKFKDTVQPMKPRD